MEKCIGKINKNPCDQKVVGTINDKDVCLQHGGRIMNRLRSGESFKTGDGQMYRRD